MDQELIQALQAINSQMDAIGSRMGALESRMEATDSRIEAMEARLLERMDGTETRLLSAFHGWSVSMELRIKSLPVIDQRLGLMEDRLSAVERKLLEKWGKGDSTALLTQEAKLALERLDKNTK